MTTAEKVAYLKGLAEGFGTDPATKEGKLLTTIIDILEDLALDLEDVMDSVEELEEGLDAVSDDLQDVEDIVFDEDDDFDDFDDEDDDDEEDDEILDADDLVLYEVECPACGEVVTFEESVLEQGSINCPNCGEPLEFDLSDDGKPDEDIPF
jgi:formylmethanofuran dehydrogenase subunit E